MKQTALVVAPGRGTYNRSELGYLKTHHASRRALFEEFDNFRRIQSQIPVSELDRAETFSGANFTKGENASPLIYSCSYADFLTIDTSKVEVVAVTGNSMGWYTALACAGALSPLGGFEVVNTMGTLMQKSLIGGQLVYPFLDADWRPIPDRKSEILEKIAEIDARANHTLTVSIDLGGMIVLAGDEPGLSAYEKEMPRIDDKFPMRLPNHAAFHSHLQAPVAEQGRSALPVKLFQQPDLPIIDGRGQIWYPHSSSLSDLRDYTLGHQVTETYDFTTAVQTAAFEFTPDLVIVLGPGNTLGGATAQSLLLASWRGLTDKGSFKTAQNEAPFLISMGDIAQRSSVTKVAATA